MCDLQGYVKWKAGELYTVAKKFDEREKLEYPKRVQRRNNKIREYLKTRKWYQWYYATAKITKNMNDEQFQKFLDDSDCISFMELYHNAGTIRFVEPFYDGESWMQITKNLNSEREVLVPAYESSIMTGYFDGEHL